MRELQHFTVHSLATPDHIFNRLKKQWRTENTVLLKVSRSYHRFGWYRGRNIGNIGGCIVMSAVQQCVLLLRHCLEGAETVFLEGNEHIL